MIKLVDIHKIYEDSNTGFLALKDINLDFKDDRFVTILGKSGSGKTTLLNIMGGLDKASSGHMVIDGNLTTKFTETQWDYFRNHKIGFIFQNYSLIEHLSVLDNVIISSKLQGTSQSIAKNLALDVLDKVGIKDQAEKYPKQLSGGQRQRVAIARALINEPDIILADEPTGSLDKKTSKQVLDLIKEISSEKLVVMVTHSKRLAKEYADRIITLKDGAISNDTKEQTIEKVKIVKSKPNVTKYKFADKIKHAYKNIRTKKWRSFLTALGLAIGVAGFILIDGISNGVKLNVDKQINAYNNSPDLSFMVYQDTLERKNVTIEEYIDYLLTDSLIESVKLNKSIYVKPVSINNTELNYFSYPIEISYMFTSDKKEELRYFGKVYDDGRWPENNDEIVISSDFASYIYDNYNIKNLWEKLDGAIIEFPLEYYYSIPYYEIQHSPENCTSYDFIDENNMPIGYNSFLFGSFAKQISTQKDLYNKLIIDPEDPNKTYFCKDYNLLPKYNSDDIKTTKTYTVVGINEASHVNYSFVTEEEYMSLSTNQISDNQDGIFLDIYLKSDAKNDLFSFKLKYKDDVEVHKVYNPSLHQIPIINTVIEIIQFIISLIMFVSVITAGIMLLMVLFISVIERSREIGILRSLGATKSDILSIFVVESGMIGFIAGIIGVILSIILAFGANIVINHYYTEEIQNMFNDDFVNIIILRPLSGIISVVVCILLAMLFGLIPAISASKKTPINALKRINK